MTNENIDALDPQQAVAAVNKVIDEWLKRDGAGALSNIESVRIEAERQNVSIPAVLKIAKIDDVTREQGDLAKEMLRAMTESKDANAREWCRRALTSVSGDKVQFDPLTATLITTGLFSAMVFVSKLYTDKDGKIHLAKLNKGDVAAIAGIAAAMLAILH